MSLVVKKVLHVYFGYNFAAEDIFRLKFGFLGSCSLFGFDSEVAYINSSSCMVFFGNLFSGQ